MASKLIIRCKVKNKESGEIYSIEPSKHSLAAFLPMTNVKCYQENLTDFVVLQKQQLEFVEEEFGIGGQFS